MSDYPAVLERMLRNAPEGQLTREFIAAVGDDCVREVAAARREGIRLGLEAAAQAVEDGLETKRVMAKVARYARHDAAPALASRADERESIAKAIRALDPAQIATQREGGDG